MNIFKKGFFNQYKDSRPLQESYDPILANESHTDFNLNSPTTVFLSHKHDDLDDLRGVIGYLRKKYNVKIYIDSQDEMQPAKTCVETARRIKSKIEACEKFIFLATNRAIDSKWCNWELGYADSKKYKSGNIAFLAMIDTALNDADYRGNEYMELYPFIVYRDGKTKYKDGRTIKKGLYLRTKKDNSFNLISLEKWLGD